MAGGAPSPQSEALGRMIADQQVVAIDPSNIAPIRTLDFTTFQLTTNVVEEERDEDGNLTQTAGVAVLMKEPPMVADLTGQLQMRGGQAYSTSFGAEFAIQVGEELVAAGREALESMSEEPLKLEGLTATPAEMAAATRAADVVEQLKGTGR